MSVLSSQTYDPVGNVLMVNTTLAAGTDNQAFCYDEQNRLTWAGGSSSPALSCGGVQYTPGTLAAAYYSTGHTYDNLDRLTSATGTGGAGTYTYGDSAHLHGVTSTSGGYGAYSATYDAAGDMTCRALTSATTCAGSTPTGQKLSYDNEGQLTGWQNTPSNPTTTATDAYDGEGNRVAQRVTSGGTTTTTDYLAGGLEEQTTGSSGTTLTKYESVPGVIGVVIVGSGASESVSYLATDGLGSVSEAFDGRGNVLGAQLYGPFGGVRYSSGTMPTARGYTGQYADAAASGLDYYGARYYDPVVGQFTSADTVLAGGLNRYAYVGNNPETATDPSGHFVITAAPPDAPAAPQTSPATTTDPSAPSGDVPPPVEGPGWLAAAPWLALGVGGVALVVWTLNGSADQALAWDTSTVRDTGQNDTLAELHGGWSNPYYAGAAYGDRPATHSHNPARVPTTTPTPTPTTTTTPGAPPTATGGGGGTPPGGRPPVASPPPSDSGDCGCDDGGSNLNPRGRQFIRLWRAVKQPELADIQATGGYGASPTGSEGKYFSLTRQGAVDYANQAYGRFGDTSHYWLTSGKFPASLITPDVLAEVDRGIPTFVIPNDQLSEFKDIALCDFII